MLRILYTLPKQHYREQEQPFDQAAVVALPAREPALAHARGGGGAGAKTSPVSF